MLNNTVWYCLLLFSTQNAYSLNNGLALVPPMGWMSWNYVKCKTDCGATESGCLNEALILSVADIFYEEGYQEAGYEYIVVDDCWSEHTRDEYGRLVPDKTRFPRGMMFLADYIHKKGLKFGMYTNVAPKTCMQYLGSMGHYNIDAKTFASWGVDYIKVDGCFVGTDVLNHDYIEFGKELNKTGRPIVYSCSWPYYIEFIHNLTPDIAKVRKYCNLWRNYHDIANYWSQVIAVAQYYSHSHAMLAPFHGPGGWNDPDMLLFGTGTLSESQSRVQLGLYAMMSAPLLLSCDMANITPYEKKLLLNMDLIAIAQDPMGSMSKPTTISPTGQQWVKSHHPIKANKYTSYTFAVINFDKRRDLKHEITLNLLENDSLYTVLDIFTGDYLRNVTRTDKIMVAVPPEDIKMYGLYAI